MNNMGYEAIVVNEPKVERRFLRVALVVAGAALCGAVALLAPAPPAGTALAPLKAKITAPPARTTLAPLKARMSGATTNTKSSTNKLFSVDLIFQMCDANRVRKGRKVEGEGNTVRARSLVAVTKRHAILNSSKRFREKNETAREREGRESEREGPKGGNGSSDCRTVS